MLHLRGTVTEGDNRVRLRYQNPRPFGEQRRMKLIDLLGKNVEDPSVFVITCSLRGHLQHSFQLRKVLDAEVTVEKLAKRFGQHMSRAQDTFSILDKKPTLGYDARDTNTFFVRLPPATILVMEAKAIFFNLLGFAPDQIKRYPKGLVGLGNEGGELITIFAREPCPLNLLVSDLFYSLESCEDLDEEEYEGLGEGNFELAFHSELPEQEVFSQCRVHGVDSPSQLAQVIRPLLRDVEGKLGLFPGILVVEEVDNALSFFVRTAQAPPVEVTLVFNDALARVMNTGRAHSLRLRAAENPPGSGAKKGQFVTGEVRKIVTNVLESLYPLLLRTTGQQAMSFAAGSGPIATLAYVTGDGEIIANPVELGEYDSCVEIRFYRRDLTELRFAQDTDILAHFKLLA